MKSISEIVNEQCDAPPEVLIASLVALAVMPAVWGRAVRLTKKRIEAATPITMAEFRADKDQLRAEFALSTRRLEMNVEALRKRQQIRAVGGEVPVAGVLGDQQAATVGQVCTRTGEAKNTYGTGNFMLLNTGTEKVPSKNGLLTTVCYKIGDAPQVYALEGSIAVTGSLIQWLRDNLGMFEDAPDVEWLARKVEDNGGAYFVPAFSGLFAPYWRSDARGAIVGLSRFNTSAHIARATLERLPDPFAGSLGDVVLLVLDFADEDTLSGMGIEDPFDLTGLYQGRSLDKQSSLASGELPPMIHLYRRPVLDEWVETGVDLEALITHVIVHEAGHHFGFSDAQMHAIEDAVE